MIVEVWLERVLLHYRVCTNTNCDICHTLENLKKIAKEKGLVK